MSEYRKELVQTAAVVVAMIESHDRGSADLESLGDVLIEIADERGAQNLKWGAQAHEPSVWLAILMEEVGEAAQAWLQATFEDAEVVQ
jgi:hypothetical protein